MLQSLSLQAVVFITLTLVGCSPIGKDITDVAGPNPQYLTKAEIIELISGEVLREPSRGSSASTVYADIIYIRRYIHEDGKTTAKTYSSPGIVQKSFWGTWTVDADGILSYTYDMDYTTRNAISAGFYHRGMRTTRYMIAKIGSSKYAYVVPETGRIHNYFKIEWL